MTPSKFLSLFADKGTPYLQVAGILSEGGMPAATLDRLTYADDIVRGLVARGARPGWTISTLSVNSPPVFAHRATDRFNIVRWSETKPVCHDEDTAAYIVLFLDFDMKDKPKGYNASDAELQKALEVVQAVVKYLAGFRFPEPVILQTGGGYHVYYKMPYNYSTQRQIVVQKIVNHLSNKFSTDEVEVDRKTYQPHMQGKFPGCWSRKANKSIERPDREVLIVHMPQKLREVDFFDLDAVAIIEPLPEKTQRRYDGGMIRGEVGEESNNSFLLDEDGVIDIIHQYGLSLVGMRPGPEGTVYFDLGICPNAGYEHEGQNSQSCSFILRPECNVGFKCMAGGCDGVTFDDVLAKLVEENDECETPIWWHRLSAEAQCEYLQEHYFFDEWNPQAAGDVPRYTILTPESMFDDPVKPPISESVILSPEPITQEAPKPQAPPVSPEESEAYRAARSRAYALVSRPLTVPSQIPTEALRNAAVKKCESKLSSTKRDGLLTLVKIRKSDDRQWLGSLVGQGGLDAMVWTENPEYKPQSRKAPVPAKKVDKNSTDYQEQDAKAAAVREKLKSGETSVDIPA
jgi:hypothetical protein